MQRRHVFLLGAAASMTLIPPARMALAQGAAAIDEAKMPALMGGAYAKMTSLLAQERAENPMVRTFAGLEIPEQEAVAAAFGAAGAEIPLREDHAAALAALQAVQGAEFDRLYVDGQIAGHEELRGIHAAYAEQGGDPMARGASMVGVPSIDTHLSILQGIRQQLA